ncbi:MAG: PP2C family protein-serine/threonine phosphatase [Phycisphaerales bacterium JB052]
MREQAPLMKNSAPELPTTPGHSLRDYWTQGTIASLCAALSELGGVKLELRDEQGCVLEPESFQEQACKQRPIPEGSRVLPIIVTDEQIGSIVVHPHDHELTQSTLIDRLSELIAQTTSEMCDDVAQLRYRVSEVAVLYRLSSLLVRGGSVHDTLRLTLDLALDVLNLNAGAIMLLPEDSEALPRVDMENELERSAAVGLSDQWLDNPIPLSVDRQFDRMSLEGKVVTCEDLRTDPRVIVPDECRAENLVSFLGTGMVFNGQPIGVIRLYSSEPRAYTSNERKLIKSIGESAAAAVEQARLLKMQARQRRTQRALRIAGAVQKRMLPEITPSFEGVELAARYQPSQEIGGDFYDLFKVHGKLGIVVGDVVGKGVVAGMLMSAVRATLRAYAELSEELDRVMIRTNDAVCRDTTVSEFVTIWYAMIDPQTRIMRSVVAGHDAPMLLRRQADGTYAQQRVPGEGMVVGVIPGEQYEMQDMQLLAGDVLLIYTDGITDAADFENHRFGKKRLADSALSLLNEQPDASADEVLKRVFWSMRQFSGLANQADDETLVVVRIED